ncbi:MAG: FAD-dependent oxidoreductase [Microthrixaceae bacterium]
MGTETWGPEWDEVADLVVVGAGAAGAAAAATAAHDGASVIVLEKAEFTGGTTAKSGGQMWVPDNPLLRERGIVDERDSALRYMARTAYPVQYDPSADMLGLPEDRYRALGSFYDAGSGAIELLRSLGAMNLESIPYVDYYAHLDEDKCPQGRTISPILPDDWQVGSKVTGGQILVDDLLEYATDNGTKVLTNHEAKHVVRNPDGSVIGVEVRVGHRTVLIGATKGIVFASGGFLHDERMSLDYLRGPILGGAAASSATGDFVRIGIECGALLGNMGNAWWDQVVVELAARRHETPSDVYSPFGDSMLMVNRFGRRALNEKAPYNERGQAHFEWDQHLGEYPNLLMFMIFDEAVVDSPEQSIFRWPVPRDWSRERPFIITVDHLDELEPAIAARLENLAELTGRAELHEDFTATLNATVERFNEMARNGVDEDFHRGETPIEQVWAGEPRTEGASPSLYPLAETGPYHCVILGPGALDTKGGPVTDENARVVAVDGEPIVGLYGAGNCIASPAGQAYWGPGCTIGLAVTYGYLAAKHAVALDERRPELAVDA